MQTNADLTLYSKSVSDGAEVWTRQVILDVQWENRKAANVIRSGLLEADKVAVYIPTYSRDEEITIKVGDVIVEGIVTREISESYTITDLKKEHEDTVTVRSVDRLDYGSARMHHLRIGAA